MTHEAAPEASFAVQEPLTSAKATLSTPAPTAAPRPEAPAGGPTRADWWSRNKRWVMFSSCAAVVAIGCVLRFLTPSHLWLDEALTVDIAKLPVPDLLDALRRDGSPPLYYLLLHVWIAIFGSGDVAVRALSGLLSVITLPIAWLGGKKVGQLAVERHKLSPAVARRTGVATLLLFASSPYAIRYGSETRMYSLVVLLVLLFGLALLHALEKPGWRAWFWVCITTAALAYTHYWTFLLLGSAALGLLVRGHRRPNDRARHYRALLAMLAAAVLFAPWFPSFVFQMLHTGTPWAPPVHAQVLLDTVFAWAGPTSSGALLGLVLLGSAFLGLTARPDSVGSGLHVDLRGRMPGKVLAGLWLMPLALAYLAYVLGGSAYAERYTGIALPAFLLLAALGMGLLPDRRVAAGVLVVASLTGLVGGHDLAQQERTQAGSIASTIATLARPGDVVAYCPDQLGPAVHRYLSTHKDLQLKEVAFNDPYGPSLVDWVDYAHRMSHAAGATFAEQVNNMAGPDHAIFLVRADGYRTLENTCKAVSDQLASFRDQTTLATKAPLLEGAMLIRFSTTN